jgi:hypothetical protein
MNTETIQIPAGAFYTSGVVTGARELMKVTRVSVGPNLYRLARPAASSAPPAAAIARAKRENAELKQAIEQRRRAAFALGGTRVMEIVGVKTDI